MEPLAAGDPPEIGPYRLQARLGAGGMGRVYLGFSPTGRPVAVKVIHPDLAADPEFRVRFRREVAAASTVSSTYTAPLVEAMPDAYPPWLVTALVPGPSLAEAVAARGALPAPAVWRLAAGLAAALQAIHSCGLVHRDLKPGNVLLAPTGPVVIDFGISRALEGTVMTATGLVVGTPAFMSPEQAMGDRVTSASDVFSLGCLIAFAATGSGPFGDGQPAPVLYRVVHIEPVLDGVPGGLRELAAACLIKHPDYRPALPALIQAIRADAAPHVASLTSFWPDTVAGLIRSHQASMGLPAEDAPRDDAEPGGLPSDEAGLDRVLPGAAAPGGAAVDRVGPEATAPGDVVLDLVEPEVAAPEVAAPDDAVQDHVEADAAGLDDVEADAGGLDDAVLDRVEPYAAAPEQVRFDQPAPEPAAADMPAGAAVGTAAGNVAAPVASGSATPQVAPGPATGARPGDSGLATVDRPIRSGVPGRAEDGGRSALAGAAATPPPALPAELAGPTIPPRSARPGGLQSARPTRRLVLGGLAAAAVGLGVAGWELSRPGPSHPRPPSGKRTSASGGRHTPRHTAGPQPAAPTPGTQTWVTALPGTLFGQPDYTTLAVAGGTAYITDVASNLNALRLADGKLLWRAGVPNGGQGPGQPVGSASPSSPVPVGSAVYVAGYYNDVMALRASDGTTLWRKAVGSGVYSDIAVADGNVYLVGWDSILWALAAASGSTRWGTTVPGGQGSDPEGAGGVVYVVDNGHSLHALRAATGSALWTVGVPGGAGSEPMPVGGVVYIVGGDKQLHAFGAASGATLWSVGVGGGPTTPPAVTGGVIYIGGSDSNLYALSAAHGTALWHVGISGGAASETNDWNLKALGPAVAGGIVYVAGGDSNLYALQATDGSTVWNAAFGRGQGAASSPVTSGGAVYIAGYDNNVYAFAT